VFEALVLQAPDFASVLYQSLLDRSGNIVTPLLAIAAHEKAGTRITYLQGVPGAGKTFMARTIPDVLVLSAEAGLLSLKDVSLPVINITSIKDLMDVYIIQKTSELAIDVCKFMEKYDFAGACESITNFLDSLNNWYVITKAVNWNSFSSMKQTFNSVDSVGNDRYCFNIKGNEFRLIVLIIFKTRTN
jgi:mRNA-degrading endonuclease HigB of HigAB toxin-antitoxin module